VRIERMVAQRPQAHIHLPGLEGAPRHTFAQVRREEIGKQRDDVEAHVDSSRAAQPQ
jgi:hypothetical protein